MLRPYSVYYLNQNVPFKTMLLKEIIKLHYFLKRTHFIFATGFHAASYCSQLSGAFVTSKVTGIGKSQLSILSIFIHVLKNFCVCANKRKIDMSVTMDQLNWVYLPTLCSLFLYCRIQQVAQWRFASTCDALPTPLSSILHENGSIHSLCR